MIELRKNDLLKIKTKKDGEIQLVVVEEVGVNNNTHNYLASNCFWFDDDFTDGFQRYEIIAVWRYDERTNTFVNIYDKDVFERIKNAVPIKANPTNCYTEPCKAVEPNNEEKPCELSEPADVPYDKYISLQSEIAELRNVIVELNKTFYGKNNQIH
jgi:hypothetical protein